MKGCVCLGLCVHRLAGNKALTVWLPRQHQQWFMYLGDRLPYVLPLLYGLPVSLRRTRTNTLAMGDV
jgi:hypothetical protein